MEKVKQIIQDTGSALLLLLHTLAPVVGVVIVLEVVFGVKLFGVLQNLSNAFEALGGTKAQFPLFLSFGTITYLLYFRKP